MTMKRSHSLAQFGTNCILMETTDGDEPEAVVQEILDSAAPAPSSEGERQRELDWKVLKNIIREFTKGQMYFAYDFGAFVSTTGQSKGEIFTSHFPRYNYGTTAQAARKPTDRGDGTTFKRGGLAQLPPFQRTMIN